MLPFVGLRMTPSSQSVPRAARGAAADPEARLAAEAQREYDVIVAMMEQQRKRDDEFLRAIVALI